MSQCKRTTAWCLKISVSNAEFCEAFLFIHRVLSWPCVTPMNIQSAERTPQSHARVESGFSIWHTAVLFKRTDYACFINLYQKHNKEERNVRICQYCVHRREYFGIAKLTEWHEYNFLLLNCCSREFKGIWRFYGIRTCINVFDEYLR
jgi:hypothetical protein